MTSHDGEDLTCDRCSRSFTQKSSLARHSKRCQPGFKAPTRQKACNHCAKAKVRCDLIRPTCGRCVARSQRCEFAADTNDGPDDFSPDGRSAKTASSTVPLRVTFDTEDGLMSAPQSIASDTPTQLPDQASRSASRTSPTLCSFEPAMLQLSERRRQQLLGGATHNANYNAVAEHVARFALRTVRSWARLLAVHGLNHLPPMMHRLQFVKGVPPAIANCLTLLRMWDDSHPTSHQLVHDTILAEIKRLIGHFQMDSPEDLLADCQALLMLMTVLFLGFNTCVTRDANDPTNGDIMIASWCLKGALARTGLFLDAEVTNTTPDWQEWAFTAAKRRTILAAHHFEWSWSILSGYPVLTCFELGPLPAPEARFLWLETDERRWKSLYETWMNDWKDGAYRMCEFFHIGTEDSLDERGERWYAEADDLGMMLIVEVNSALELAQMNP
ncbi:hypothetical protein NLU13_5929 [Sarocladium strictum]|uniref:Zn(2)-C6 fungal-type domain-containing protein n=1 Tax=Sarocladium strictum TaxID=5046 RepID=A0AA39GEZ2_SARSR|nr:hypothetical protein NLU13_5929 [Sarocladium strictum]